MNWTFLRREWGAVTFVLTVIIGIVIVPLALYLAHQGPATVRVPTITTVSSPRTTTPTPAASPTATPKVTPSPTPKKSP